MIDIAIMDLSAQPAMLSGSGDEAMRACFLAVVFISLSGCTGQKPSAEQTPSADKMDTQAGQGPFGLDLSAKISSLQVNPELSEPASGRYVLSSVPRPSPDFPEIVVWGTDEVGICTVQGLTRIYESDAAGLEVKAAINAVRDGLVMKYGKPTLSVDRCNDDIMCQSGFWSMALMNGVRSYGYAWQLPSPADNRVSAIYLGARSTELASPYGLIEYEVNDKEKCDKALNKLKAEAL